MTDIVDIRPDRTVAFSDLAQIRAICNPRAVRMTYEQVEALASGQFRLLWSSHKNTVYGMEILIRAPDPLLRFIDQEIGL